MLKKKIIALLLVGGMMANFGVAANAVTKSTTSTARAKTKQTQKDAPNRMKLSAADMQKEMKTKLDALVTAGTILQTQEDKILAAYAAQEAAKTAEMTKVNAMTEAERKAYFDSKTAQAKTDVLAALVTDGTITQAQSDAVKAAVPGGHGDHGMRGDKNQAQGITPATMEANMKTQLDTLVTAGTITQTQEDAVIAAVKAQEAARTAEMTKVQAMTEAERKAYFASNVKTAEVSPLATLVTAGTITQAQSDAISKLLPGGHMGHGMNR